MKSFKSKYLFKKVKTDSIPTIKSATTDTSFDDESDMENQNMYESMVAVGSSEKISKKMSVDYDQGHMTAHIDISSKQLTGDDVKKTEEHGRVQVRREYPNRERTTYKESYPFSVYEGATDVEVKRVSKHNRFIDRVDGITFDLLVNNFEELNPRDFIHPEYPPTPPNEKKVKESERKDTIQEQLDMLFEKVDEGTETDADLAMIEVLNKELWGKND